MLTGFWQHRVSLLDGEEAIGGRRDSDRSINGYLLRCHPFVKNNGGLNVDFDSGQTNLSGFHGGFQGVHDGLIEF
jgi:hypothetical protein